LRSTTLIITAYGIKHLTTAIRQTTGLDNRALVGWTLRDSTLVVAAYWIKHLTTAIRQATGLDSGAL
jgi:hypothetical protein